MTAHEPHYHDLPPDVRAAIEAVRADREHGASWLARQSAAILADSSTPASIGDAPQRLLQLQTAAQALAKTRPSMAAVANTAARIAAAIHPLPCSDDAEARQRLAQVHQASQETASAWSAASSAIYSHVRPLLSGVIYTHSRSGTVEYALTQVAQEQAQSKAEPITVFVSESHPGNEGVSLATTLARLGMAVTLVADAACGLFVHEASAIIIGADSVRADGSVINKVGTLPLALVAREAQVSVYVVCKTLKIAAPDFPVAFEEMDASELLPVPQPGITVRNSYFDQTPHALISGIITEQGLLTSVEIATIAGQAAEALALLHRGEQAL